MHVSPLVVVAAFTLACGDAVATQRVAPPATPAEVAIKEGDKKTSTDPAVNPNAAAMAEFKARVDKYADLHKQLAKGAATQKDNSDPAQINAAKTALVAKVQAARANAKQGDIFTPEVRLVFRRLLAPELKGEDGRDAKAVLKDDAPEPGSVPFKVNARYPEGQPIPSVPANLLLTLPSLPAPLEYRIVGQHLLLIDTATDLIVDYILNAAIT
ncbi:MAG: hypothetical protein HOP16_16370 [Acidobacteria bacterium]|nr:hypothetical protein [Acidobacteriota bacterium]